jgi:hypothetical protein
MKKMEKKNREGKGKEGKELEKVLLLVPHHIPRPLLFFLLAFLHFPSLTISFFVLFICLLLFFLFPSSSFKLSLSYNPLGSLPAGMLAQNPLIDRLTLVQVPLSELGQRWLGPAVRPDFTLTMRGNGAINCSIGTNATVVCTCGAGLVGGPSGFCVRPCSQTIVSGLWSMDAGACPGFRLPQDLWPGSRPCVLNTSELEWVATSS